MAISSVIARAAILLSIFDRPERNRRTANRPPLLFFLMVVALSGCQTVFSQSGYLRSSPALIEIDEHIRHQRFDLAVESARKEIRNPFWPTQSYKAKTLLVATMALTASVNSGASNFDEEIDGYYNDAVKLVGEDNVFLSELNNNMGNYFLKRGYPAEALRFFHTALKYGSASKKDFHIMVSSSNLSFTYGVLGEHALRENYLERTINLGNAYFFPSIRLPLIFDLYRVGLSDWTVYKDILMAQAYSAFDAYLETHDGQKALNTLRKVWDQLEPTLNRVSSSTSWKYSAITYVNYLEIARLFAQAGDGSMARGLYDRAKQVWEEDKYFWDQREGGDRIKLASETNFKCFKAFIDLEDGTEKIEDFETCNSLWLSKLNLKLPLAAIDSFGRVYEKNKKYELAILKYSSGIDELEAFRKNVPIDQRTRLLGRGTARSLYWGLIRTSAKYASLTKKQTDRTAALQAIERFRSRQLWEKLSGAENLTSDIQLEEFANNLKDDTTILNYVLSDKWLIILAVSKEAVVPIVQEYDGKGFADEVRSLARDMRGAVKFADIQPKLTKISGVLLGRVRPFLQGKKQIIVVPDEVLNLIPFDLLSLESATYRPILKDMLVRTIPSLRALQINEPNAANYDSAGIFAVGDPIYGAPVASGLTCGTPETSTPVSYAKTVLSPLPDTKEEILSIAALFDGKSKILLGTEALESTVKHAHLDHYKYLHFATHGILGGNVPGLGEPALVLGQEPDEDGCLTASEVAAKLKLRAEVTVLSACSTGNGEQVTGEGVMGMSRAFMLAGSRSVMVSLWEIESAETVKLMKTFYHYVSSGMDPAKALRLARMGGMKNLTSRIGPEDYDSMRAYYYWSGFVLIERSVRL